MLVWGPNGPASFLGDRPAAQGNSGNAGFSMGLLRDSWLISCNFALFAHPYLQEIHVSWLEYHEKHDTCMCRYIQNIYSKQVNTSFPYHEIVICIGFSAFAIKADIILNLPSLVLSPKYWCVSNGNPNHHQVLLDLRLESDGFLSWFCATQPHCWCNRCCTTSSYVLKGSLVQIPVVLMCVLALLRSVFVGGVQLDTIKGI